MTFSQKRRATGRYDIVLRQIALEQRHYLWVLHPVAQLSYWVLMMASIATKFSIRQLAFIFLLSHYMFRPLRAILS
jgi:hypothetical protein